MNPWDQFTGVNAGYVYDLYERYQADPTSVDEATRALFATWSPEIESESAQRRGRSSGGHDRRAIAAFNLAESIRRFGHLAAQARSARLHRSDWRSLAESAVAWADQATRWRGCRRRSSAGPRPRASANALEAIERLRAIYCATTGHDYNHVFVPEERVWLRQAVETGQFRPPRDPINAQRVARSHHPGRDASSGSCIARSRARRASRSKAST